MTKDRIIDVLVLLLIGVGSLALAERYILEPRDVAASLTKLAETFALPIGLAVRMLKWLNDEKADLIRRIENTQNLAVNNREGYLGTSDRLEILRNESDDLSDQVRDLTNSVDKRLIYLETTTSLARRLEALELRISELDGKLLSILVKDE